MDGQLSFDVHQNGAGVVISVWGEVDMATAPQLEECLGSHPDRDVTVNLAGVPFLDSSGMAVLVRAANAAADAGHTLGTVNEHDNVHAALKAVGLLERFHADNGN
jgi:anti-anti-sigma factor